MSRHDRGLTEIDRSAPNASTPISENPVTVTLATTGTAAAAGPSLNSTNAGESPRCATSDRVTMAAPGPSVATSAVSAGSPGMATGNVNSASAGVIEATAMTESRSALAWAQAQYQMLASIGDSMPGRSMTTPARGTAAGGGCGSNAAGMGHAT